LVDTPKNAYKAACELRAKRLQQDNEAKARVISFPTRADERLADWHDALRTEVPEGLKLFVRKTIKGDIGDLGFKGLVIQLAEDDQIVAQGAIVVSADERVFITGYTPDGDQRPVQNYGEFPFSKFNSGCAVDFMSRLITTYIA
jgi:hypothetical protein